MAEVIRMPKMSDTMEEGVIASWQKKEGDKVESGDILAEVETDKATMELESYEDGTLLYIGVKEQESVPINSVIAIIGKEGEDIGDLLKKLESEKGSQQPAEEKKESKAETAEAKPAEAPAASPKSKQDIDTSDVKATVVTMPKMSDTMTDGTIASWQKKVGDKVASGDILAEVETDKATMELEAYEDGTLLYVGVKEGESVPVDGVIAIIGEEGADYKKLLKARSAAEKGTSKTPVAQEEVPTEINQQEDTKETSESQQDANGRIKASPLAKKLAADLGYDIAKIKGSGEHGRIIKRDVESYEPQAESAQEAPAEAASMTAVVGKEAFQDVPVSQMRKTIAKRLAESKFTSPHFYLTMEINMDKAVEARKSLNEIAEVKISYNDIVIKAVASALRKHPHVNASWQGDKIRISQHIHIGMAVAIPDGLVVPVIRFADGKSISQISAEAKALGQKAKDKKLQPQEWEGNTFTISNLGMFGIEEFTAIINPPDSCILAVGGINEKPVVRDGALAVGHVMKVTLSCDHRAVDGAVGAAFLKTLKEMLEDPIRIIL
jgi:pyruvate dehydrogenase E2 component (dihydrolipoamide acetyltransferase)